MKNVLHNGLDLFQSRAVEVQGLGCDIQPDENGEMDTDTRSGMTHISPPLPSVSPGRILQQPINCQRLLGRDFLF